jgi:hypothetical protein
VGDRAFVGGHRGGDAAGIAEGIGREVERVPHGALDPAARDRALGQRDRPGAVDAASHLEVRETCEQ